MDTNFGFFHIFNRGAHKAPIFHDVQDYEYFTALLCVGNTTKPFRMRDINPKDRFKVKHTQKLVEIIAYCLMPNHYHLLVEVLKENGHTHFMRKICTSYSNYYNIKYMHSGTVFQGGCKSKLVGNEAYLRVVFDYIHLNPYGIEEPELTRDAKKEPRHIKAALAYSKKYIHSSFRDYLGEERKENSIVSRIEGLTEVSPRYPLLSYTELPK